MSHALLHMSLDNQTTLLGILVGRYLDLHKVVCKLLFVGSDCIPRKAAVNGLVLNPLEQWLRHTYLHRTVHICTLVCRVRTVRQHRLPGFAYLWCLPEIGTLYSELLHAGIRLQLEEEVHTMLHFAYLIPHYPSLLSGSAYHHHVEEEIYIP